MRMKHGISASVVLLAGFVGLTSAYEGIEVAGGGTISGTVKFAGNPPAPGKLEVSKDQEVCGKEDKVSETLVVSAGKGIKNAVVSLAEIQKGKSMTLAEPGPVIKQKGCVFQPHVLVVPAGASVDILNDDGILHNFHTTSKVNPVLNRAQPQFMKKMKGKFDKPEVIKVGCDVHSWMNAWIVVADHPYYAVTDENGAFALKDVPPGTYKLQIWHESLGTVTKDVTVSGADEAKVAIELGK